MIAGPDAVRVAETSAFAGAAAGELARILRERAAGATAGAPGADISLALAGGSTPGPVYERLADIPGLPWDRVTVFFGDERCVPPADPRSNFRLAREALLSRVRVPEERVHRMACEAEDPEAAAARYAALLPERLDLLLLGIGEDGHTASLFPGSPALSETARRVVPARAPEPPRSRLTVTPPVLRAARTVVVLAAGAAKADAVRRALEEPWRPEACPAQLARGGVWILDSAAAGRLGSGRP